MLDLLTHKDWCRFIGSIVKRYIRHRNHLIDLDDLEQEAWQALLLASRNYDPDKSNAKFTSYAWIYINYSVRELLFPKKNLKHKVIPEIDMGDTHLHGHGILETEDPFDDFELLETNDTFKVAITELSAEDFELVDQHFVQNLTFVDMATMNDVTPQAMQQRLKQVIKKLQRYFNIEDPNSN